MIRYAGDGLPITRVYVDNVQVEKVLMADQARGVVYVHTGAYALVRRWSLYDDRVPVVRAVTGDVRLVLFA